MIGAYDGKHIARLGLERQHQRAWAGPVLPVRGGGETSAGGGSQRGQRGVSGAIGNCVAVGFESGGRGGVFRGVGIFWHDPV